MTKKRSTRIVLWVVFSILALLLIAFVVRLGFSHVCTYILYDTYVPFEGGPEHQFCEYRWIGYEWIFNGG
jgi:hypothetical protein